MQKESVVMSPIEEPGAAKQYLNMCDILLCRVHKKHLSTIIWLDALINGLASWETLWAEYWSAQGKPGACSALEMREGKREREWYTRNEKRPTIQFRQGHMCTFAEV